MRYWVPISNAMPLADSFQIRCWTYFAVMPTLNSFVSLRA